MKKTKTKTKPKNGKKKFTKEHVFVLILFLVVLGARLFFTLQDQGFDYDSYNALRQVEHIKETGLPLFKDELSYSGRTIIFPPFFYYLLAAFSFIVPLALAAKLLPSIALSSLVIIVYLITKYTTKNRIAAFIAAFFSGFVPVFYTTLNQISIYSLAIPLIFLLSYSFLRIEEKGFAMLSIILMIILLLTHTSVFILLISLLAYFVIVRLEKLKTTTKEVEITLFLLFLALWFNLLLYKKAFFIHGLSFILQNIPAPLLSSYFKDISFIGVIYAVGIVPLLLGVYAVYHVLFKTRNRSAVLYISFALVSFIMLWLKLIPLRTGLLFLSINLIILSASSIKLILVTLSKTRMPRLSFLVAGLIIILFILTTISPFITTITTYKPQDTDINALEWIKENTQEHDVILGRLEEGFLISYIAQRKNVMDYNFLFIDNINQRYDDVNHLFTLRLKSEAVRLLNRYEIDYILLTTKSMQEYNVSKLFYADEDCFELVYDKDALIYEFLRCEVE